MGIFLLRNMYVSRSQRALNSAFAFSLFDLHVVQSFLLGVSSFQGIQRLPHLTQSHLRQHNYLPFPYAHSYNYRNDPNLLAFGSKTKDISLGRAKLHTAVKMSADPLNQNIAEAYESDWFALPFVTNATLTKMRVEDCMTVADIRMRTFRDASIPVDEIAYRFALFQVTKDRLANGAHCIMVCLHGPFTLNFLPYLRASPHLCMAADRDMLQAISAAGAAGGADAAAAVRQAEQRWRAASTGRRIVAGCVDCSTHEFLRSPRWAAALARRPLAPDMYISDMAVLPAFQGLGLGRRLLRAALAHAAAAGFRGVYLHVEPTNARACTLYGSEGFAPPADPASPPALELYEALCFDRPNALLCRPAAPGQAGPVDPDSE